MASDDDELEDEVDDDADVEGFEPNQPVDLPEDRRAAA